MNKNEFIKELEKLNIKLTNYQAMQLEAYYKILIDENKKYNLTSITKESDVYLKHFYDSLTIVKIINLKDQSLCDIGTGAGFPGLVLKIVFPELHITLLDSTNKKCKFLESVVSKLKLKDITIINERAEEYSKRIREKYDIVTSRAVAPLKHLLEYSIPLLKIKGQFIALKSNLEKELIDIDNYEKKLYIKKRKIVEFTLPKEESKRTLIEFIKLKETSLKYPRKYSEIKKKQI